MEGLVCGRYRITGMLGEGGMATVYTARHELINQDAAVKLLQPQMSANQKIARRFLQEAQAAAAINHPSIVKIYDVGYTVDGRAYITMERLHGESLGERLKRVGTLPLDSATTLIYQLAGGMGAAHGEGIIHRDLKPDNIFIVPDPDIPGGERVKILDFGLAKLSMGYAGSIVTGANEVFGTPAFMAPEQCRGSGGVDARADIYSIGCLFYRCLCGQPPFSGRDAIAVLSAHLSEEPVPPARRTPGIPPAIDALIMRMLEKSPDRRVQTCAELMSALDSAPGTVTLVGLKDSASPAHGPPPPAPAAPDDGATIPYLAHGPMAPTLRTPAMVASPPHVPGPQHAPHVPGPQHAPHVPGPQHAPHVPGPQRASSASVTSSNGELSRGRGRSTGNTWFVLACIGLVAVGLVIGKVIAGGDDGNGVTIIDTSPAPIGAQPAPPDAQPAPPADASAGPIPEPADAAPSDGGAGTSTTGQIPDAGKEVIPARPEPAALSPAQIQKLIEAVREAYAAKDDKRAVSICRKALAIRTTRAELGSLCTYAACRLRDAKAAKRYFSKVPAQYRSSVWSHCEREGVQLDTSH